MEGSQGLDGALALEFPSALTPPTNTSMKRMLNFYLSKAECQCHSDIDEETVY